MHLYYYKTVISCIYSTILKKKQTKNPMEKKKTTLTAEFLQSQS